MADYVYFHQELLQLQEEISKHHELMLGLSTLHNPDIGESLATVAHYLGIPVDETMNQSQLLAFADMLTRKLYEERTGLVITTLH